MKVVIMAGGLGTRLGEETHLRPKPMVEVGGEPILWHIMKIYAAQGFNEFVILLGYKSHMIKDYFLNYYMNHSDCTVDLATNTVQVHGSAAEQWKVTLVETGLNTGTAGRLARAKHHLKDAAFMLTYGDGVSDINLHTLLEEHKKGGRTVTVTTVQPEGRFGVLDRAENGNVNGFMEKPIGEGGWINAGYMVMEPEIFNHIPTDPDAMLEAELLEPIAAKGMLHSYAHTGFWRAMDSLRDKNTLEKMWADGKAKWRTWGENGGRVMLMNEHKAPASTDSSKKQA